MGVPLPMLTMCHWMQLNRPGRIRVTGRYARTRKALAHDAAKDQRHEANNGIGLDPRGPSLNTGALSISGLSSLKGGSISANNLHRLTISADFISCILVTSIHLASTRCALANIGMLDEAHEACTPK